MASKHGNKREPIGKFILLNNHELSTCTIDAICIGFRCKSSWKCKKLGMEKLQVQMSFSWLTNSKIKFSTFFWGTFCFFSWILVFSNSETRLSIVLLFGTVSFSVYRTLKKCKTLKLKVLFFLPKYAFLNIVFYFL